MLSDWFIHSGKKWKYYDDEQEFMNREPKPREVMMYNPPIGDVIHKSEHDIKVRNWEQNPDINNVLQFRRVKND